MYIPPSPTTLCFFGALIVARVLGTHSGGDCSLIDKKSSR